MAHYQIKSDTMPPQELYAVPPSPAHDEINSHTMPPHESRLSLTVAPTLDQKSHTMPYASQTETIKKAISVRNVSTVPVPSKLPLHFVPLTRSVIDGVEKFVIFIGYPRSGHSIIGSYMDSHPNMIIAHEYPLFKILSQKKMSKYALFNVLYKKSYDELFGGWRGNENVKNKGYSLAIEGLWQATFDKLKVIGNKHGGVTVHFYRKHPALFLSLMDYLRKAVDVPIYLIHVVRNPFDMIATQSLYVKTGIPGVRINASVDNKFNETDLLTEVAIDMLERASAAANIIRILNLPTLELRNEDLIHDPIQVMTSVCKFVGVECPGYYLKACKQHTFSSSSKSRHFVVWPSSLIDSIHTKLKKYIFFQQYSFSD